MTFRDHCIIKAALTLFAQQASLPDDVAETASNGGQFSIAPADAAKTAAAFDAAMFVGRLLGDLTRQDAEHLLTLADTFEPTQKKERAMRSRQQRFLNRALSLIGPGASAARAARPPSA